MVADVENQKRKLEDDVAAPEATKRAAADVGSIPRPIVAAEHMQNEDFSMDLLRVYYDRLFPFQRMHRWLSYRNTPESTNRAIEKDFFLRREFTFVLEGDIFCRYLCFRDAQEFKAQVMARMPIRMEIGAVFTHPPKNHTTIVKDAYRPLERELVFDIDMDDYDDIRTCCTGAKICAKCWTFMRAAIRTLDRALREDFGFEHLMFVYSGRRGVHCWVCDKTARGLSNEQRSAVAEYLSLVTPGTNKARADLKMLGCEELHPSIVEAHSLLEPFFLQVLDQQQILRQDLPHLSNILDQTLTSKEREDMNRFLEASPNASSVQIWREVEKLANERSLSYARNGTYKQKAECKTLLKDVVIQYTYPRLDINVSKQMNHLLKSPFVAHPKTGRVCVPIDTRRLDEFDPATVPTIGRLVEELNASGSAEQTSLRGYTSYFETQFLQPLERDALEQRPVDFSDW